MGTSALDKRLPDKIVSIILLPADTLNRKQTLVDSLSRKPFFMQRIVLERNKRSHTVWVEAKYDGQSRQEAKIRGLVYHLFYGKYRSSNIVEFSNYSCISHG